MATYDVIVIGAGPGGYVCAIRCAQLGLKTACVEGRETLGGTCLNVGCIPSKALLHASELYHEAHTHFDEMGLIGAKPKVDLKQMLTYKQSTVDTNTKGIEFLFKKNKIDWLKGWGKITGKGEVTVGDETHSAKNIVVATGSEPASLPGVEVDEERVVTSTGALELPDVPKKMVVIGAGVIGLELGSVYARLGSDVTVVEYLDVITPGMDGEVQKVFQRMLKKQGLSFVMGAAVQGVEKLKSKLKVTYKTRKKEEEVTVDADVVLVATGRKPYTEGLGLKAAGVEMTDRGMVKTDAHLATNVAGIWAIGDAVAGPMLAHKAEDEGMAVAERIAGKAGHVNYDVIPGVIYTAPEVASVGADRAGVVAAKSALSGPLANGRGPGWGWFKARAGRWGSEAPCLLNSYNTVPRHVHLTAVHMGTRIAVRAACVSLLFLRLHSFWLAVRSRWRSRGPQTLAI